LTGAYGEPRAIRNYFGDAAQWWGFYLLAASTGWGALTFFSPLLMTFLLVRVSGVALLEKTLQDRKPGYAEYAERTSGFVPWIPRPRGVAPISPLPSGTSPRKKPIPAA
jgi:steroid 5-alpha reductase family enzyme